MQIIRELKGAELILTTITMLTGQEGKDYCYYETDGSWWILRLYISRN